MSRNYHIFTEYEEHEYPAVTCDYCDKTQRCKDYETLPRGWIEGEVKGDRWRYDTETEIRENGPTQVLCCSKNHLALLTAQAEEKWKTVFVQKYTPPPPGGYGLGSAL